MGKPVVHFELTPRGPASPGRTRSPCEGCVRRGARLARPAAGSEDRQIER
jgi:hypothetical protein